MTKRIIISMLVLFTAIALEAQTDWRTKARLLNPGGPPYDTESPRVACSKNNVYVVWLDRNNYHLYVNSSRDNGTTWLDREIRLDDGSASDPQIACSGKYAYVVWQDYRDFDYPNIYFNSSHDRGMTWMASDIRLSTGDGTRFNRSHYPIISCSGKNVYVAWLDYRYKNNRSIYFNFSTDGGETWQTPDIRLNTNVKPEEGYSWGPSICSYKKNVYVAWAEGKWPGSHIFFNRSTDGGMSWLQKPIRIDRGKGNVYALTSHICCSENNIYLVWDDERTGKSEIYLNYSTDEGVTWQQSDIRLTPGIGSGTKSADSPRISCSGKNIFVVWESYWKNEILFFYNYSTDGGVTWQNPEIQCDPVIYPSSVWPYDPEFTMNGDNVYFVWSDERNSKDDIYFNFSKDGGATWQNQEIRLDTGDDPGEHGSYSPQIACQEDIIYVVWEDARNSRGYKAYEEASIYFNSSRIDNTGPTADAGPNLEIQEMGTVSLDGSGSFDPKGGLLSFRWSFISVPEDSEAVLRNAKTATPHFSADKEGVYRIQLVVKDFSGRRASDEVKVTAAFLYAPLNFKGQKALNRSLLQVEYINSLVWQANPENRNIVRYRIYEIEESHQNLLIERNADIFSYLHRGVEKDKKYIYALAAVDRNGREGERTYLTVK